MNTEINDIIWSLEEAGKALAAGDTKAAESYLRAAIGDLKDPAVMGTEQPRTDIDCELEMEAQAYGDPRRCEIHGTATSSPDGMFDAPCADCESEMQDLHYAELEAEEAAFIGPRQPALVAAPWTAADEEQYQRDLLDPTFFNDIPF